MSILALSDNVFLLSILIVYMNTFSVDIFNNYTWICKLTVYTLYISSFMSVWCVVMFNIERFLAVFFPFSNLGMIRRLKVNKFTLCGLFTFSLVFYSFSLYTSELELVPGTQATACTTSHKWHDIVITMSFVDILISIIIPFTLLFICNALFSRNLLMKIRTNNQAEKERTSKRKELLNTLWRRKRVTLVLKQDQLEISDEDSDSNTHKVSRRELFTPEYTKNCSLNSYLKGQGKSKRRIKIKRIKTLKLQLEIAQLNYSNLQNKFYFSRRLESKSHSISDIYELKSQGRKNGITYPPRYVTFTPPTNSEKSQAKNSKKKLTSILQRIWRESTELKKTKSYMKATKMVVITSLAFILLNSPMAFSKMYNFFRHDMTYKVEPVVEALNRSMYETYDAYAESINLNIPEEVDLKKQICERLACYLYYLNFCLNLVFYSLSWPKKARKKLADLFKPVVNFRQRKQTSSISRL